MKDVEDTMLNVERCFFKKDIATANQKRFSKSEELLLQEKGMNL